MKVIRHGTNNSYNLPSGHPEAATYGAVELYDNEASVLLLVVVPEGNALSGGASATVQVGTNVNSRLDILHTMRGA